MKKSKTLFLALTATMLVACAPPSDPSMSEPSTSEPSTNTSPSPTTGTMFSDFTVTSSDSVLLLIGNESKIEVQETDVIFTSENPDIATVDSSGTIKAKNVGSTRIVLDKSFYTPFYITVVVENTSIFDGEYNSLDYKIQIEGSSVKLNGIDATDVIYSKTGSEDEFKFDNSIKFTVEEKDYVISYQNDLFNTDKYIVNLNDGVKDYRLNPSIEEFSGSFTWDGSGDPYNVNYVFGNYMSDIYNGYDVGMYLHSQMSFSFGTFFALSSYVIHEDQIKKAIDVVDIEDDTYFTFIVNKHEDGQHSLFDLDYGEDYFFYDPILPTAFLMNENLEYNQTYFNDNKFYKYDDDFNEYVYDYEMIYDEEHKSEVITLKNAAEPQDFIKYIPTPYGFYEIKNGVTTEYISKFDISSMIDKTFVGETVSIAVSSDPLSDVNPYVVTINEESAAVAPKIINHRFVLTAVSENYNVFISTTTNSEVIKVTHSNTNTSEYGVSLSYIEEYFGIPAMKIVNGVAEEISLSEDKKSIKYQGSAEIFTVDYDPFTDTINLNFLDYSYRMINLDTLTYELFNNATKTSEYFIATSLIEDVIIDTYTSDGIYVIGIHNYGNNYVVSMIDDVEDNITLGFRFNEYGVGEIIISSSAYGDMIYYLYTITHTYNETTTTYIPLSRYAEIVGEYVFESQYGLEKFYVELGHFYADTLVNGELVKKVEYSFSLMVLPFGSDSQPVTVLAFNVPDASGQIAASILLYFNEYGQLLCFETPYVFESIYQARGAYKSESNSIIYLYENQMILDGEKYEIINTLPNSTGTVIEFQISNGDDIIILSYAVKAGVFIIDVSTNSKYPSGSEYFKQEFDMDSFIGTYTTSKGEVEFAYITNPFNGLNAGYKLIIGENTYTEYSIVIRNGYVAVEFKVGIDTYYFYNNGTSNVCEYVEGGALPPPPPPPPLPPM